MIDSSKLWTKLPPKADNIEGIIQDLKAGLVPNLPYFIIDNKEAKEKISKDILNIDTQFSLAYIIANYGNGKTNLLRYLEYFFNAVNSDRNIIVAYWRADVDKYDLILFLLYIIQIRFKKQLISAIQDLSIDDLDDAAIKYEDAFGAIEEYVSCIKSNKVITAKPKAHAFKNEMCFPLTKTKCELKKHPNSKFECFFNDFNRTKTSLFLPFPSKLIQDNLVCVLELQE